ncbi:21711_t:CDS:1, partial [Dentiscutata erythropus]
MLICLKIPSFSQIFLYYPEIFIALYSNALSRVIGGFESETIINLCTSRIQIVEIGKKAFLNTKEKGTEEETNKIDVKKLHIYLFFGYLLLPCKHSGTFKFSEHKFPLFRPERCIIELCYLMLRLCGCTFICSTASFLTYNMLVFTNNSSPDKFSVFLMLALVFQLVSIFASARHFYLFVYTCISFFYLIQSLPTDHKYDYVQFEVNFILPSFYSIIIISISIRLFLFFLIFLTGNQIIYPSLASTVFEVLLTLALLRPISNAESQAIDKWYDNHSTRVKVSICRKNPAKNHIEVIQVPDPEKEPTSDLENQAILLGMQLNFEEDDNFEEEELDIFNFMIYLLLEMKFFA